MSKNEIDFDDSRSLVISDDHNGTFYQYCKIIERPQNKKVYPN